MKTFLGAAVISALTPLFGSGAFAGCVDFTELGRAPIVEICGPEGCEKTFLEFRCANIHGTLAGFANGFHFDISIDEETNAPRMIVRLDGNPVPLSQLSQFSCKPLVSDEYLESADAFEAIIACDFF